MSKTIETPYDVPKAEKGLLKVLYPEVYIAKAGSPKLNDKNWTVFINPKTRMQPKSNKFLIPVYYTDTIIYKFNSPLQSLMIKTGRYL